MIEIKSRFNGWIEVSEDKARKFAEILMNGMINITEAEKENYINTNKLRGITVSQLRGGISE
jgi:hypothetical protein